MAAFVAKAWCGAVIYGETGSGKDSFVSEVQRLAVERPVGRVPAGNITDELAVSQLFGHIRGGFSGAVSSSAGLGVYADQGWLAFNDADDMSPALQELLLAVGDRAEYWPPGAAAPIRTNARMILMTHRSPRELLLAGDLRADLFYRLDAGITVRVPPLRERVEDLPAIAAGLLDRIAADLRRIDDRITAPELSDSAVAALSAMPFPGNVRELENALRRAMRDPLLRGEAVPPVLRPEHFALECPPVKQRRRKRATRRQDVCEERLREALASSRTRGEAAEKLGLDTRGLYRRMEDLGIPRAKTARPRALD